MLILKYSREGSITTKKSRDIKKMSGGGRVGD